MLTSWHYSIRWIHIVLNGFSGENAHLLFLWLGKVEKQIAHCIENFLRREVAEKIPRMSCWILPFGTASIKQGSHNFETQTYRGPYPRNVRVTPPQLNRSLAFRPPSLGTEWRFRYSTQQQQSLNFMPLYTLPSCGHGCPSPLGWNHELNRSKSVMSPGACNAVAGIPNPPPYPPYASAASPVPDSISKKCVKSTSSGAFTAAFELALEPVPLAPNITSDPVATPPGGPVVVVTSLCNCAEFEL